MRVHTIMACQSLGHDNGLLFLYRNVWGDLGKPGERCSGERQLIVILLGRLTYGLGDSCSGKE